ncbi:MAG: transketolase [Eubacterium sp.]|nr:transketolase [Eubacterium sp.]
MDSKTKRELQIFATQIRIGIIQSTYSAKAGHPGGSLSSADVFAYLYGKEMKYNPAEPKWDERDRFVLSKGHCAPGLYSALAYKGFFPVEDLKTLRHIGSYLQGHPNMNTVPGVDMSTGSLGQGVSVAAGMAKAAKFMGKDINVYTLLGDGEIEEGQVWEAMMFAAQYKLDNLCVIIDSNGLQIDGSCEEVMSAEPIDEKLKAFGLEVVVVNGNDFDELEKAFDAFHATSGKPFAIVMKTIKGLGVSYMENEVGWHGKAPNDEEYEIAMAELNAKMQELEA